MAKSKSLGWWRSGKLSSRLLWLGGIIGAIGAVAFNVNYMVGHVNLATFLWGLGNLSYFEIPVGIILGLVVAGATLLMRAFVPSGSPRLVRAIVTGIAALISTSTAVSAVLRGVTVPISVSDIAWLAGALAGGAFAMVSYRHASQLVNPKRPA